MESNNLKMCVMFQDVKLGNYYKCISTNANITWLNEENVN